MPRAISEHLSVVEAEALALAILEIPKASYALHDEFCAHRGVSLWFAHNEDNGLRCAYHGWKYDHTGHCVDVPSEPQKAASATRSN
jgi:phenylpropionate dioxygenase-like ring-hydroxylating dioxygenase large terminal subunit